MGNFSSVITPLFWQAQSIGTIAVTREPNMAFSAKELHLLQTFADQAVIAIENARLFNETREALERETSSAEILRVISSSPTDVQPVFDAIVASLLRLFGTQFAAVQLLRGPDVTMPAVGGKQGFERLAERFPRPLEDTPIGGLVMLSKQTRQFLALEDPATPDGTQQFARDFGFNSVLFTPMIHEGQVIGCIGTAHPDAKAFDARQIALIETFARQAVIAIQNARLFNETQQALERQTATAEILKVIASSPDDVQPVFKAIAGSANGLLGGFSTAVFRFVDDIAHLAAFTPTTPAADSILQSSFPMPLADFEQFELAKTGQPVEVADIEEMPNRRIKEIARARGFRSMLFVPLMNGETPIGLISVTRTATGSFAGHHVQLLQTFADQAVIAIENVRLFNEVQAKTRELAARNSAYSEQIDHQSATIDILKAMSASQGDAQPVFDVIVRRAQQICNADLAVVLEFDGTLVHLRSIHVDETSTPPRTVEAYRGIFPQPPSRASVALRAIYYGRIVHIPNMAEDADLSQASRDIGRKGAVAIPLMRDGEVIGSIGLSAKVTGGFSEAQIELLKTFAEQAVIAIRSAETFRELNTRTRDLSESLQQQTATADVLKVISSSPGDLEPVFKEMLENATRICEAHFGNLWLCEGDAFRLGALYGAPVAFSEARWREPLVHPGSGTGLDRVARTKQLVHIADLASEQVYIERVPSRVALVELAGARTYLMVPMLKDNELVGSIAIYRQEVRPFSDKQIELVTSFADQAVIAIENTRLLRELRQRTDDLTRSLDDLRTAQDRLVQTEKLASLGQLTAGIAHEIKNPLNFVNNFSALSAELTDELNDALKPVALDSKVRQEVEELTRMLKDNLEKVVQHGKRADSIVKNMLLHSREGSGEQRAADINTLLDESLNLAYHGARAEKSAFNITLQRDFDSGAGEVELFPQEITRAFLNFISNGFYAATRRKAENGDPAFEPLLAAATKNLGDSVEIRIRDNGTGIPAEVREKMFNPFFTTKPAGEGTGLGLSMSHDIIVKQHGGSIDVETEPGQFTELRIVLPRRRPK